MYCCCLSLAVKFMAHIKAPHYVADRQYIFSTTGDHDFCCLVELRLRSLWITMQGDLSECGLVCRPQSLGLGMKLQCLPLCLYIFMFPNPYQLLQSLINSTRINIRVYSFSACSRKPLRSATCFPASCSTSCSSTSSHCFVLFMSHIELPLPSSRANLL